MKKIMTDLVGVILNGVDPKGTTEISTLLENLGYNRYQIAGALGAASRYRFITVCDRRYNETEQKIRSTYL